MRLRRERAELLMGPHYSYLVEVIRGAWSDYRAYSPGQRLRHSRRSRASIMNDLILARANAHPRPGIVRVQCAGGLTLFAVGTEIVFRYKKLRPNGGTSNIATQQSLDFIRQRPVVQLVIPEVGAEPTHLNVGYLLSGLETDIASVRITCPQGAHVLWSIDVTGEVARQVQPVVAATKPFKVGAVLPFQLKKGVVPDEGEGNKG